MKTYTFHVSLPGFGRVWRKIEMQSDKTLEDLHWAIQDAFEFDGDHLYSFFMSGRAWDQKTEYCLPEGADPWGFHLSDADDEEDAQESEPAAAPTEENAETPNLWGLTLEDIKKMAADLAQGNVQLDSLQAQVFPLLQQLLEEEEAFAEPRDVRRVTLEELNLKSKQQFLYLFDYGDEWRFNVRVHAINPNAPEGDYPRIVESVGEAPEQYPSWDEEEEDQDDDDTV
jgi:hypothetical protein